MNTNLWHRTTFSKNNLPSWNCPHCKNGLLELVEDKFNFEETESSKKFYNSGEFLETEYISYIFNGFLKCSVCKEFVVFLGNGEVKNVIFKDYNDEYYQEYVDVFKPYYFFPPPHIFSIAEKCPNEIKNEIIYSFSLFWNDLPSCANKIRTSLEMIMNQQKVTKTEIVRKKRKQLTLHKRIEIFKLTKPEIANFLLAIKWIGNAGSHIGILERFHILDAYELLELSINKLYDDSEVVLKKKSKEIIKRKGARKKR